MDIILKHKYIGDYWNFIYLHKKKNWNWFQLHDNPFLCKDKEMLPLEAYYDLFNYNYYVKLKWDKIISNPNKYYDWFLLSLNKNITLEIVKLFIDKWDWYNLSKNEAITWHIISNNFNLPWDWRGISMNKNISTDIIRNNINYPWNFHCLSYNCMSNALERYIHREMKVICYLSLKNTILLDDVKLYICSFC